MDILFSITTFQKELFLLILDKGILGLLIILGGFVLNKAIEKYKSKISLKDEVLKKEINAFENIASSISEYEDCILEMHLNRIFIMQATVTFVMGNRDSDPKFKEWMDNNPNEEVDFNKLLKPYKDAIEKYTHIYETKLEQLEKDEEILAQSFFKLLAKKRFWLKQSRYDKIEEYFKNLHESKDMEFDKLEDLTKYISFHDDLNKNRFNINMIIND